jgi:hypothetical protein
MPHATFKRWTADDIAKLKSMAQKHPSAEIASQLGRSTGATIVQAHKMKLSLRLRRPKDVESSLSGADPGPRRV